MAITNGYVTLSTLKSALGITDTADDVLLEMAAEAASRQIDNLTGRRFWTRTETRLYTPSDTQYQLVEDIAVTVTVVANTVTAVTPQITSVKSDEDGDGVFETTWATTDYECLPSDYGVQNGRPVEALRTTLDGNNSFTRQKNSLQIVALYGYNAAVPMAIQQATLITAMRMFQRRNAIFGVAGVSALGQESVRPIPDDKDINAMVANYKRLF
jgi:hypothetical protein